MFSSSFFEPSPALQPALAMTHDGKCLFAGNFWDCSLRVYALSFRVEEVSGGEVKREMTQRLTRHKDRILCLALGKDGKTLVTGGADCCVLVWDVFLAPAPGVANLLGGLRTCVRPDPRHTLTGHSSAVVSVAVHTGLDTVVSVTACGQCFLHSPRKGVALIRLRAMPDTFPAALQFTSRRHSMGGNMGAVETARLQERSLPRRVLVADDGSIVCYSDSDAPVVCPSGDAGANGGLGGRARCKLSVCTINGRYWRSVDLEAPLTVLVANEDSSLLLTGSATGDVTLRRMDTLELVQGFESAGCCITSLRFSQVYFQPTFQLSNPPTTVKKLSSPPAPLPC